jgi:UDP-N-acetylglucosamine 4,6-dehydratase
MRIGITGISGSLGTALVERFQHEHVIVGITRDELKAEKIMAGRENVRCMVVAAGLDDLTAMRKAFDGCQVIIHAAALKRISGSVYATGEVVKTNITGTQHVLEVAQRIGARRVIVVSSDKAVEATNLYGASKFCAECLAVQENAFAYPKGTSILVVRYGNVLGSRGSVVHIWRDQVAHGTRLTVTDRRMTRFIVTLDQATKLIDDAMQPYFEAGDIIVPQLRAARMVDVADAIKREAQRQEFPVVDTGLRPGGEKLHESLLSHEELHRTYRSGEYYVVKPSHSTWKHAPDRKNIALAFPDGTGYTSDAVERFTVPELVNMLQAVPNRPPND